MVGKFQEIQDNQLCQLKDVLELKLPFTTEMLNILWLKIQGHFTNETLVSFFIYGGLSDGWKDPFVLCQQEPNMHGEYCILLHAPESPTPAMISALDEFVLWERFPLFPATPQSFYDNFLKSLCLKRGGAPKEHPCEAFALSRELSLSLEKEYNYTENGEQIQVRSLNLIDVDQILGMDLMKVWMHSKTRKQIEQSITNLATTGIYVSQQLAAFAMLSPVGLMNNVWTEEPWRRRGLALKVLQSLSRRVAELGCTPMAECTVYNDSSRQLLKKAGFIFVQKTNWVTFKAQV